MSGPAHPGPSGLEPDADDLVLSGEDSEPIVGRTAHGINPIFPVAGLAIAAILLFVVLNGRRTERLERVERGSAAQTEPSAWSAPPPLALPATPISAAGPSPFSGLPAQVSMPPPTPALPLVPLAVPTGPAAGPFSDIMQRRHAPAVVIDLGGPPRDVVLAQADAAPGSAIGAVARDAAAQGAGPKGPQLNESEQFAKRVGEEEAESARAVPMRNPRAVAPQGTIIPGVLETAINSDLPGFTRAVVSRDVLSFDGKAILIPKGSRLIGQYKSAVALGQSRAFIIWTRVIRPDGGSIQIGSPGTDELGRGGLNGEVNRHFFRRFSGSILLSVLNAGVASVGQTPATQISIGSPGAATGLATSALQGDAIPPTIKVAQGEAINIFVARDLDFSAVGPAT